MHMTHACLMWYFLSISFCLASGFCCMSMERSTSAQEFPENTWQRRWTSKQCNLCFQLRGVRVCHLNNTAAFNSTRTCSLYKPLAHERWRAWAGSPGTRYGEVQEGEKKNKVPDAPYSSAVEHGGIGIRRQVIRHSRVENEAEAAVGRCGRQNKLSFEIRGNGCRHRERVLPSVCVCAQAHVLA